MISRKILATLTLDSIERLDIERNSRCSRRVELYAILDTTSFSRGKHYCLISTITSFLKLSSARS